MVTALNKDRPLVEASLDGDTKAFECLVAKYQSLVCSVAYSATGDLALSEDVAQETFLAAWRGLKSVRNHAKVGAWLSGIARNLARDTMRRGRRDLAGSAQLLEEDETAEAQQPDAAEQLANTERAAVVWRALEAIPENYREPLVLFYRQEQSVREVAEALDLSEDAVKQRLSRGRKMLKEQVAALVEDTLAQTQPNAAFTAGVMAALPGISATSVGTAAGAGATAAKGANTVVKAIALGVVVPVGATVGAVVGMLAGFFGARNLMRNMPTLRCRRYAIKVCCQTYALIWGFLGLQGMLGVLLWRWPAYMYSLCGITWIAYLIAVFWNIVHSKMKGVRLYEAETKGGENLPPLDSSECSLRRVRLNVTWTFSVAVLGSVGVACWLHSMPWTSPAFAIVLATVSHTWFAFIIRTGVRTALDDEAFAAFPPSPKALEEMHDGGRGRPRTIGVMINLFFGVFRPMAWLVVLPILSGDVAGVLVVVGGCTAVLVASAYAVVKNPEKRFVVVFWAYLAMALFGAAIVALKWPAWALIVEGWPVDKASVIGGAGIYLGLYLCFGCAALYLDRKLKGRASRT